MADYTLNPPLLRACRNEAIRRRILSHLSTTSLSSLRATSCAFSNMLTRTLFSTVRLTFTPSSLTRQCRIDALARIGHHIRHFTFSMHHCDATFLPPLLSPRTGQEINFLYTPHTSLESERARPRYGSSELGETLTAQYPAIFHAATNVPAFIRALASMPNLEHISISCPDQQPVERYRRSAVDYALISLRIAIERAELPHLRKLSLACHPAALLYLHPTPNFGASPSALRRWRRITSLKLSIDAWPFDSAPKDHLKLLANYLRVFAGSVEKLTFHWYGQRGPCPLTMPLATSRPSSPNSSFHNSPTSPSSTSQKLFLEITSPMSPLPLTPPAEPLHFERLRRVQVRNTHVTAAQVARFITRHAGTIKGLDFDNVVLTSGTWDDALHPLGRLSSKDAIWEARHSGSFTGTDADLLLCGGSALSTPSEERDNPYTWTPRKEVQDQGTPLRESVVEKHMAATPSHISIARKHKRRRRRRASPAPPPPAASLRHQASHLLGKLRKEASASSFFGMFKHHNSSGSSSHSSTGSFHSPSRSHSPSPKAERETVEEALGEDQDNTQLFLATPRHNRAMPPVPPYQSNYVDLGEHDMAAYEPGLETLLQPTTYTTTYAAGLVTPPRTPTRPGSALGSGTPRSQIWEFDRPSSLASIEEMPLLAPTTYTPLSDAQQTRHPLDRRAAVEDAPPTPPQSPLLLSAAVYSPPSSSGKKSASPCQQGQQQRQRQRLQEEQERVRGQPVPRPPPPPPTATTPTTMPALTPMLAHLSTPMTPWPCLMTRSLTPMPLRLDTSHGHQGVLPPQQHQQQKQQKQQQQQQQMDTATQGNRRDRAREGRWEMLANDAKTREEVLRRARERVLGRLGRMYSGREGAVGRCAVGGGSVREEQEEMRVAGGRVQDAVRREMWTGCGEGAGEVRESAVGGRGSAGRDRSVLVPFMILR